MGETQIPYRDPEHAFIIHLHGCMGHCPGSNLYGLYKSDNRNHCRILKNLHEHLYDMTDDACPLTVWKDFREVVEQEYAAAVQQRLANEAAAIEAEAVAVKAEADRVELAVQEILRLRDETKPDGKPALDATAAANVLTAQKMVSEDAYLELGEKGVIAIENVEAVSK